MYRGGFQRLFNASEPIGDRRYGIDVPEDYVPLSLGPIIDTGTREAGSLSESYSEVTSVHGGISG